MQRGLWGAVRATTRALWLRYALLGAAFSGAYYLLPLDGAGRVAIFIAAPAGASGLCLRAVRRAAPASRPVWASLAIALALASASDVVYLAVPAMTGHPNPFPSAVDVLWLGSYPFYVLAIWTILRHQQDRERGGNLLDVAIIASSGAIPLWAYLVDPVLDAGNSPAATVVVSALYPSLDLLVFAFLLRFVVSVGGTVAMRLLVLAVTTLLCADVNYVFQLNRGTFGDGGLSDALWIGSAVLVGVAALHPSARHVAEDRARPGGRLTAARIGFLALGVLVGPAVLSSRPDDTALVAAMSSVSFLLVMGRMWLLNRRLTAAHAQVARASGLLEHQARHDALTGLPNRALVVDRIARMQDAARRLGTPCALLHVDVDGFKAVNDALGHDAGDRLLVALADRLRTALCGASTVARLGGDEFLVLIGDAAPAADPETVADRLRDVVRQPVELGGPTSTVVSASVGIACGPGGSTAELLRQADLALHEAKTAGRDTAQRFRPEMEAAIQRRYELEIDLRSALARGEFFLLYQPVYTADGTRLIAFEALLRWRHPVKGLIGPNEFVPLLEASGQIVDVGRWVLATATQQAARWQAAGARVNISVNVSGRQLDRDSVVAHVAEALELSGLPPEALTLEITETALMTSVAETTRRLGELKALGARLAIDDFGTGYSSLAYLQRFPVDCLKIDRTFTVGIGQSPESDAMLRTLVQL
ncbi:MAG TPA: EAL domain-containing protein, partial [Jatrophihabitans sp.]|nr:EAL domain-containing protein [Jatrophihabitans sp.]